MHGNVRVGRESLTKKISFHDKNPKPYRTIDSLQKAPTRKKINLHEYPLKKESHLVLTGSSHKRPSRKVNSLTKYELGKPLDAKKKSIMSSEPELATLEGIMNRNIKFSISREKDRERPSLKQKYKRSQQVRSLIEHKKMSSISRMERKETEPNPRISHIYSSITSDKSKPHTEKAVVAFNDLNLETLINTSGTEEHEVTLQDVFEAGCLAFYQYLEAKEQKMAETDNIKTIGLKLIKEELSAALQKAIQRFQVILQQAGEMSIKNVVMIALASYEQGKWNETIMYLNKALDKTNNNLMLVELPSPSIKVNQTLTMLSSEAPVQNSPRCYKLNLMAYLYLAEAYKNTNNFLCGINTLLGWEQVFSRKAVRKVPQLQIKTYYQTLQPSIMEQDKPEHKMKKKSHVVQNIMLSDLTTSKFKKYSQAYHHSSIEFNKSNKHLVVDSHRKDRLRGPEDSHPHLQTIDRHSDSRPIMEEAEQQNEYQKEVTEIYLLLARLYFKIKSYDSAMKHYKKCLQCNPRKIEAVLELASLFYTKRQPNKCLEWLEASLKLFSDSEGENEKSELDVNYIKYHKCLVLFEEGYLEESYKLLQQLTAKELSSEVNYFKGFIRLRKLNKDGKLSVKQRNSELESILMHFKQAIASFTSRQYLVKSYFQILLVLVFEKKDYYGAQYEVNRFRKLLPAKTDPLQQGSEDNAISRISRLFCNDDEGADSEEKVYSSLGLSQGYFAILFDIIDAVICVLKMKIAKGLCTLKELSLRVESQSHEINKYYGSYQKEIIKLILQFKFYAYYVQRQYELSLKHINKLIAITQAEDPLHQQGDPEARSYFETDLKLLGINRLMLECMILMKQGKFNYAMSKLAEIENSINQSNNQQGVNNALVVNNFYMVKALCFINLYSQLEAEHKLSPTAAQESADQTNKEILLSAEELLRHCLISDKENSLIYYLISAIHYEVQEYESSLKYIREALEYSDDHMIKHYFCKANTKAMLGRYDEAIKDYSNAIIVFKQQLKNEAMLKPESSEKKPKKVVEDNDDYYQERQIMFNEIYLNRAIVYIKEACVLSKSKNYSQNVNIILSYRMKAAEDLCKYFQGLLNNNIDLSAEATLRERLLLFMHTDDPSHIFKISQQFQPRLKLLKQEDTIKAYYLIKQLNNCISNLRTYLDSMRQAYDEVEKNRVKIESIPAKNKKLATIVPKKSIEPISPDKIIRLHFDLTCLEALKKSSGNSQESLEEALISLLELTEEVYQHREEGGQGQKGATNTLEQLFINNCGTIFKWSDILFFIGVIHFELKEYETAIKYFQQSYNEKIMNNSLHSLERYLYTALTKSHTSEDEEEQSLFAELEPLFENRIYCKEELQYNLGVCYLMLKKYKQAYFYLQNYPHFLTIIKKEITVNNVLQSDNQFLNEEDYKVTGKGPQILIDEAVSSQRSSVHFDLNQESRQNLHKRSLKQLKQPIIQRAQNSRGESVESSQRQSEGCQFLNITPFPTKNRLCSIYPSKKIDDKQFYLSFCLPKVELPKLGLFFDEEIEPARIFSRQNDKESSISSSTSALQSSRSEKRNFFRMNQSSFESVIGHISLLDLQMKPIAPWIKQNTCGVIFTENLVDESVELNSSRMDRKKDRKDNKDGVKKSKNQRYGDVKEQ